MKSNSPHGSCVPTSKERECSTSCGGYDPHGGVAMALSLGGVLYIGGDKEEVFSDITRIASNVGFMISSRPQAGRIIQ